MNRQSVRPGISKEYTNRMRELRLQANAQAFANMLRENRAATRIQGGARGFLTRKKLKQNRAATKIQGGVRSFLTRKKLKQNQLAALQREYLMRYRRLLNNRERLLKQQIARAARMEKRVNKLKVRNRFSTPMKLTNLITGEVKIYKTKRFYEQALKKQLLLKKRICG